MNPRKKMRAPLGALGLLLLLGACASKTKVREETPVQSGSSQHVEIQNLERRIAERKGGGRGHSPAMERSAAAGDAAPSAPMTQSESASMSRCDGVCVAAQEICTWHRRICILAAEINDAASAQSCQRSQRDCDTASNSCASCR